MNPVEVAVSVGLLLFALAWMVGIELLKRWMARALDRYEQDRAARLVVARVPVVDDEPTEIIVREPAIYTDRDPTVQVNVRKPQPWEWAK